MCCGVIPAGLCPVCRINIQRYAVPVLKASAYDFSDVRSSSARHMDGLGHFKFRAVFTEYLAYISYLTAHCSVEGGPVGDNASLLA